MDYVIAGLDILTIFSLCFFFIAFRSLEKSWKKHFDYLIRIIVNVERVVAFLERKVYWLEKAAEEKGWDLEEIARRYSNY